MTKDVIEKTITITQEIWKKGDNFGEFKDQEYKLEVIYSNQVVRSKEIEVLDNVPPTKPETGKST